MKRARDPRDHAGGWALGIVVVLLVTAAGVALTTQGWRSRIPAFDLLTYIRSIREFLATGAIPAHGDVGSYASFKPAGTAWAMLPSTILFDDPRLSEYAGAGLLYFSALAGLFLLARKYFGTGCACLAVVLYGLSDTGIFLAGSLWPNGRPEFLIWMVYLASQWVTREDPRYLGAALAVWGAGIYVDMAITPALLVLPALWWMYRAPMRPKPVLVATAVVVLIWLPYLRFEAPREFSDIRSQLTFTYLLPADYKSAWCNPDLSFRAFGAPARGTGAASSLTRPLGTPIVPSATASLAVRLENAVEDKLLSNFAPIARVPGRQAFSVTMFLLVVLSAVLLTVTGARAVEPPRDRPPSTRAARLPIVAAGAVIVGAGLFALGGTDASAVGLPDSVASPLQTLGKLLAAGAIGVMIFRAAARVADLALRRAGIAFQDAARASERRLLAVALGVPWLTLVAVAEPDKPERFWWLWGLQVLFLAAFVTEVLPRLGARRAVVWAAAGVVIGLVAANGQVLDRAAAWRDHGWAGADAPEIRVIDYVADELRADGKARAAIGYRLFVYRFMPAYHIRNAEYKVGSDFDLLLQYRGGISNADSCAEGFSAADEYRIVRTVPRPEEWAPRLYFHVPLGREFELVRDIYPYRIYKRTQRDLARRVDRDSIGWGHVRSSA